MNMAMKTRPTGAYDNGNYSENDINNNDDDNEMTIRMTKAMMTATGQWTLLPENTLPAGQFTYCLVISPTGHFVYWSFCLRDISPTRQFTYYSSNSTGTSFPVTSP